MNTLCKVGFSFNFVTHSSDTWFGKDEKKIDKVEVYSTSPPSILATRLKNLLYFCPKLPLTSGYIYTGLHDLKRGDARQ